MSETIFIGERDRPMAQVTLYSGSSYIVVFKQALHLERMVAKFMEKVSDNLLFSLRPEGGTVTLNLEDIIRIERALRGSQVELPHRIPWEVGREVGRGE